MNQKGFLKRLQKELPAWLRQGWVTPGGDKAILDYVAAQGTSAPLFAYVLGIFGVLLLGSGVITYFAANWGLMPKLVKLALLFGSLWAAYGVAAYLLKDDRNPYIAQSVVLLGVILFGANIMLIAQIYHIDSHYPNGVLLWSLGGLLAAYLLRSQPAMVAAIALAVLWSGMESFGFDHVHWWFLILWAALLPLIYQARWRVSLHGALVGLLLWSFFTFGVIVWRWSESAAFYVVEVFFLTYLAVFLAGMLMATKDAFLKFAPTVQHYGILAVLISFYSLTSPRFHSGLRWSRDTTIREAASTEWIAAVLIALAIAVGLALWHRQRTLSSERPAYLRWGQGLIALGVLMILANLFLSGAHGGLMAIGFNILYFMTVAWLVFAGMHTKDRFLVNTAFIFFALGLLTRYFDTFWTLMNRSFFFMAGGVILLVGGYLLERQRRRITGEIAKQHQGESRS